VLEWTFGGRRTGPAPTSLYPVAGTEGRTYARSMTSASTQPPTEPDELEKLRRDRGEGWDWTRIQRDPCPQCGQQPAAFAPSSLGALAVEEALAWRQFLLEADDAYLRAIPEPGVFSPMQYGAHVRDILRVYTDRMVLGIEQDNPTVPIFNPPQEVFEGYNRLDTEELAADLGTQAERLAEVIKSTDSSAWSRIVINDRGQYGVYTFTIAGLACNAVHETHHHLLDAKGTLEPSAPS
jgi:hypothetical protein